MSRADSFLEVVFQIPGSGSIALQAIADPTGELNEAVWKRLGHLRGTLGPLSSVYDSGRDDSVAIRYPNPSTIKIPKPENLQLNELYWPTLLQHASELWVAVAMPDDLVDNIAKVALDGSRINVSFGSPYPNSNTPEKGIFYCGVLAGCWFLDQFEKEELFESSDPQDSKVTPEIAVLCITDDRVNIRDRITKTVVPDFSEAGTGPEPLFDVMPTASLVVESSIGTFLKDTISNDTWEYAAACRHTVDIYRPVYSVWSDSVNIGLGCWPVVHPFFAGTEELRIGHQRTMGFLRHSNLSMVWPSYSDSRSRDAVKADVSFWISQDFVQDARSNITSSRSPLSGKRIPFSFTGVAGIIRHEGLAYGNVMLIGTGSEAGTSAAYSALPANTSFFLNLGRTESAMGSTADNEKYGQWLDFQNSFRALAMLAQPRVVAIGNTVTGSSSSVVASVKDYLAQFEAFSEWPDAPGGYKRFPPSAWIFRLGMAGSIDGDLNPDELSYGDQVTYVMTAEEMPWIITELPKDFPVTWKRQYAGVKWVDAGRVGEYHKIHYNHSTTSWMRPAPVDSTWYANVSDWADLGALQYRCEAINFVGFSVLSPLQVSSFGAFCDLAASACQPPIYGSYQSDTYTWYTRKCTAMIARTSHNAFTTDSRCWEMIWAAEFVYRIDPAEPGAPTTPTQPPPSDEPINPQPGLPVPPGYG